MKVKVRFFAFFREIVGYRDGEVEVTPGTTVGALWDHYRAQFPRLGTMQAGFAVNASYVPAEHVLQENDVVAFIPPVSGGAGDGPFFVTTAPLDAQALAGAVADPAAGAIVVFQGVVRNHSRGRAIRYLEYEAYPEMAEQVLTQIGAEMKARWPLQRVAIAHRVGRLEIGETSIVVAVSAAHRAEAFAAVAYAMDRVKQIAPVWKKEYTTDGNYWVEGPEQEDTPFDGQKRPVRPQKSGKRSSYDQ